jgi:hypothetical protein
MSTRAFRTTRPRRAWRPQARALCLALALPLWLPLAARAQAPVPAAPAAASSPATSGGSVYKWKDASGRVHYGDQPPVPKAAPMKLIVDQPSEEEVRAARERLETMQAESEARAAERRAAQAANAQPPASAPGPAAPANETACEARWRAYEESVACFDPFRLADGSVRPEDMAKCKPVKRPEPCS